MEKGGAKPPDSGKLLHVKMLEKVCSVGDFFNRDMILNLHSFYKAWRFYRLKRLHKKLIGSAIRILGVAKVSL